MRFLFIYRKRLMISKMQEFRNFSMIRSKRETVPHVTPESISVHCPTLSKSNYRSKKQNFNCNDLPIFPSVASCALSYHLGWSIVRRGVCGPLTYQTRANPKIMLCSGPLIMSKGPISYGPIPGRVTRDNGTRLVSMPLSCTCNGF